MIRKSLFQPPWWLRNAHLQTCFAPLVRSKARPVPRNERLELPDGDFVDLSWFGVGVGPVVVVLHGLGGSIDSAYARGIVTHLSGSGFRVVLMHFRGCSGVLNRKLRAYHSGDTEDVRYLFSVLRDRLGDTPLGAVGYSLGTESDHSRGIGVCALGAFKMRGAFGYRTLTVLSVVSLVLA